MYGIRQRFSWSVGLAAVAFLLLVAALQYQYLRQYIIADGKGRLRQILSQAEAVHTYCRSELRPAVARLAPEAAFEPEAMSGTYITRRVMELFTRENPSYTYKFAALEPRNPANRADEFEAAMIRRFTAEPGLKIWEGEIARGGEIVLVTFSPFVVAASCLRCHDKPEDAPRGLVERYGTSRGFSMQAGQIAGVRSVSLPLGEPFARARWMVLTNLLITLGGVALLLGVIGYAFHRIVARPVHMIETHIARIGQGEFDRKLPPLADNEIGLLGRALEQMRTQVREKTADLERRNAELTAVQAQLRSAHDDLDALYRAFPDGILILQPDGGVIDLNPSAADLLKVPRSEAVGKKCYELCFGRKGPPCDSAQLCPLARVAETGAPARAIHHVRPGPDEEYLDVSAILLPVAAGKPARALVVLRDVTAATHSRAFIQRKSAELEGLIHALGHDLKAPLANIKGMVEMLEGGTLTVDQTRHFLSRVHANADTMGRLIADLVELSRIDFGQEPAEDIAALEVVEEALRLHEQRIAARGAAIRVLPGIPRVRYPRTRLLQVFSNLIGNALSHTGEQPGLRIDIACETTAAAHAFSVTDNGPGIDLETQLRIFEPFFTRAQKGNGSSGLGLTIVKRIVEKNGGSIRVETEPGRGASFIFTIPG
jgi:signal transduction histidine kinase/HAMP domain-containing protein